MGDGAEIDVFWCSSPTDERRAGLAKQTMDWWNRQPGIRLHVLTPEVVGCELREFNRYRRVFADQQASTEPYIVTDDDCIPECDILEAVKVAKHYPQFGTLSLWPSNCNIYRWTEIEAFEDSEVMEHCSVGIIRICQKGMPFPPSTGVGYDRTHGDAIREAGWKVGLLKNYKALHLGEGNTSLWNQSHNLPQ